MGYWDPEKKKEWRKRDYAKNKDRILKANKERYYANHERSLELARQRMLKVSVYKLVWKATHHVLSVVQLLYLYFIMLILKMLKINQ